VVFSRISSSAPLHAVDGGGPVQFGGEGELGGEDLALLGQRRDAEAGDARIVGP